MNVSGETKIWAKDFNGRMSYSRVISAREYKDGQKGDWMSAYESVQFPKGTDIPNGSTVELKGFESIYKSKDGLKRKLVVQEYKIVDKVSEEPSGFVAMDDDIPF